MQRSYFRGHPTVWNEESEKWLYADDMSPTPTSGGEMRPCVGCGKTFTHDQGEVDPCIGVLPGVDNACCGHGVKEKSFVRFETGVVLRGFDIKYTERWKPDS